MTCLKELQVVTESAWWQIPHVMFRLLIFSHFALTTSNSGFLATPFSKSDLPHHTLLTCFWHGLRNRLVKFFQVFMYDDSVLRNPFPVLLDEATISHRMPSSECPLQFLKASVPHSQQFAERVFAK